MPHATIRHFLLLLVALTLPLCAAEKRAEWQFDEGMGNQAASASVEATAKVTAQWATGPFGKGLYFSEEASETATVPDSPAIQFGTQSFAISLWLCPTQLAVEPKGQYRRLLAKNSFPGTFWTLDIFDTGRVMFAMRDGDGHTGTTTSQGAIPEGKWTLLTIVVDRDSHATSYFFNGQLDSKLAFPAEFTGALDVPGKPLQISIWRKYVGVLDSLAFLRGVPTAEQIAADWQAGEEAHRDATFTATPLPKPSFALPRPTGDHQTMWDTPDHVGHDDALPAPPILSRRRLRRGGNAGSEGPLL